MSSRSVSRPCRPPYRHRPPASRRAPATTCIRSGRSAEQPLHLAIGDHRLQIGVPRRLQVGIHRLEQLAARLMRVGPPQQRQQRMVAQPLAVLAPPPAARASPPRRSAARSDAPPDCARTPPAPAPESSAASSSGRPGRAAHQHLQRLGFGNRRSAAEQAGQKIGHVSDPSSRAGLQICKARRGRLSVRPPATTTRSVLWANPSFSSPR